MHVILRYLSPLVYGLIVVIWTYILIFYIKKINQRQKHDKLLSLLLYILIIVSISTILSNIYFGLRQSSHDGIIPIEIFNVLSKPENVFFPKFMTLAAGVLIFIIVLYKWLPTEEQQKIAIKKLIKEKNSELITKNQELTKAKLKAEESDKLKTKFLKNISHEIRTPMNAIMGFSQMLDIPDISNETRTFYSGIVQNNCDQLLKVIDDILEISSLERKHRKINKTQFFLNDFLMELFTIFNLKAQKNNISFKINKELKDSESEIITDKTKLNRIISNLLENAFRYTHDGSVEMGYSISDNKLILYVKDTGMGISEENREYIFERFSQEEKEISLKHGGLGLGLSISKENAKLLGGDISLESVKGKGSTFYVTIPLYTSKNIISG